MKILNYKEAVAAWKQSLLDDALTLSLNIAAGSAKAYMGDTLAYNIISKKTEEVEEDGSNLIDIASAIENYKIDICKTNPKLGYVNITQEENVDFTTYGNDDVSIDSVTIHFEILGLVPKSTEEILALDLTASATKHSFQVWLFRYTEDKEKHSSYVGYFPIKCEILKLYRNGTIDLLTLQKVLHGGCDV